MATLNQRGLSRPESFKRRVSILLEFPEPNLETIVVQWEHFRPSLMVQLIRDPREPIQFPGKRLEIAGNADLPSEAGQALDQPLRGFMDPASGRPYEGEPFNSDIVFSARAFSFLQPEPDLVLPEESLWSCRAEALGALSIADKPGTTIGEKQDAPLA